MIKAGILGDQAERWTWWAIHIIEDGIQRSGRRGPEMIRVDLERDRNEGGL